MKAKRQTATRVDDGNAFLPDIADDASPGVTAKAADAEFFGEEYIGSATTGESVSESARDEVVDEEEGGPFLVLSDDGSLPVDEEGDVQDEGHEPVQQAQSVRGAKWMARGA
ncbi:MAG: hypothetical protein KIT84_43100 [Labilithrix sp.]|nr:hypothetical protein [Labilithrix sp.]MCW5817868.1 hypothetical protein [Labilithrix sp.]